MDACKLYAVPALLPTHAIVSIFYMCAGGFAFMAVPLRKTTLAFRKLAFTTSLLVERQPALGNYVTLLTSSEEHNPRRAASSCSGGTATAEEASVFTGETTGRIPWY